jgi:hypothetical protein
MLSWADLRNNLEALDLQFRNASSTRDAHFCCKLALLELAGWTEQAMDSIISECASRTLSEPSNKQYCADSIVKNTYGFEYQKHFRGMMMRLIGLVHVERIERQADAAKLARLEAALQTLKILRDPAAHTHINGMTAKMNAPSFMIGQLTPITDGLQEIERVLIAARL